MPASGRLQTELPRSKAEKRIKKPRLCVGEALILSREAGFEITKKMVFSDKYTIKILVFSEFFAIKILVSKIL